MNRQGETHVHSDGLADRQQKRDEMANEQAGDTHIQTALQTEENRDELMKRPQNKDEMANEKTSKHTQTDSKTKVN